MCLFCKPKKVLKSTMLISSLKSDVDLFSRLFIVCVNRDIDFDDFFAHENQPFPTALSLNGVQRSSDKSSLVKIFENVINDAPLLLEETNAMPTEERSKFQYDCVIYDGPALIHILLPEGVLNFSEYSTKVFQSHIKHNSTDTVRLQKELQTKYVCL